ncbi:MAG: hypothetical protein ACK4UN_01285 [Limisphaerales bacterium]
MITAQRLKSLNKPVFLRFLPPKINSSPDCGRKCRQKHFCREFSGDFALKNIFGGILRKILPPKINSSAFFGEKWRRQRCYRHFSPLFVSKNISFDVFRRLLSIVLVVSDSSLAGWPRLCVVITLREERPDSRPPKSLWTPASRIFGETFASKYAVSSCCTIFVAVQKNNSGASRFSPEWLNGTLARSLDV